MTILLKNTRVLAKEAIDIAKDKIASGAYDIIILDEVNYAVKLKLISEQDILDTIGSKAREDKSRLNW